MVSLKGDCARGFRIRAIALVTRASEGESSWSCPTYRSSAPTSSPREQGAEGTFAAGNPAIARSNLSAFVPKCFPDLKRAPFRFNLAFILQSFF